MTSTILILLALGADPAAEDQFANIKIEKPFDAYLKAQPLLMEVTGAKVIRRQKNEFVVLGVASTILKDSSARERLRAEKVCRIKALAAIVAEKQGIQVAHVEQVNEATVVVIENGEESATSVTEYLQMTKARVEGVAKDMPVVGTWTSLDGTVFFLAIGAICDKQGEPIK